MRCRDGARAYLERRTGCSNTKTEAVRAVKRRLSDVVYRFLLLRNPRPQRPHLPRPLGIRSEHGTDLVGTV